MNVSGVIQAASGDSLVIRADDVRFADLGTVPFAQGELRFAAADVSAVAIEVIDRKRTAVMSTLAVLGALVAAEWFTPNTSIIGFGRKGDTPRR